MIVVVVIRTGASRFSALVSLSGLPIGNSFSRLIVGLIGFHERTFVYTDAGSFRAFDAKELVDIHHAHTHAPAEVLVLLFARNAHSHVSSAARTLLFIAVVTRLPFPFSGEPM